MHHFCTLFDANYLPRALVLHRSLLETREDFMLLALCMDDASHRILTKLALPRLVPVPLREFETAELRAVKPHRTRVEYCWTCTPFAIRFALDKAGAEEATYLDADMRFYAPPSLLLDEFHAAGASVLITAHRYMSQYDQSASSGTYCVQFVTVRRDERGLRALQWWQDRCLEWCHARFEPGRYGDQKYLDDWPERFEGTHVLEHPGGGVAPWNVQRHRVHVRDGHVFVDEHRLVFFHFQDFRLFSDGTRDIGQYPLSADVLQLLYGPYQDELCAAHAQIRAVEPGFAHGWAPPLAPWRKAVRAAKRVLRG